MKNIEIKVPEYTVDKEPDDKAIGKIIDDKLKENFNGDSVLIRGIASSEHPEKSIDELISIIEKTGSDRYDPSINGDRYENIEGKKIDLFAFPAQITESTDLARHMIWGFYHSAIGVHGRPMRIDIITIYDAEQMQQVFHQYKGREDIKDDGFVFKQPGSKSDAVLGIIKLTQ